MCRPTPHRDIDFDAPFAADPTIVGEGDLLVRGDMEFIKHLIPEGWVEVIPQVSWPVYKMPSRWHRFWMRFLMGWKFKTDA